MPALANSGEIGPRTQLRKDGMPSWAPAQSLLPQLFPHNPSAPPPPLPADATAGPPPGPRCHELDYELFGNEMQIEEVVLDPGETVIAEAGAMDDLKPDLAFEAGMGRGTVWLQSLPFPRLADRVRANIGSGGKGEGSVRRGLGNLLEGD